MSQQQPGEPAASPPFWRSLVLFWLFTILRFGLFAVLWLLLWLVGVGWLIAGAVAVVISIPLSWVLLAKPRQAFAANIEQRVNARFERTADLNTQLDDHHSVEGLDELDQLNGEADHEADR